MRQGRPKTWPPPSRTVLRPSTAASEVVVEIAVALLDGVVKETAVELHVQVMAPVGHVAEHHALSGEGAILAATAGEPVWPFDPRQVTVLQNGAGARLEIGEDAGKPLAPADPASFVHRGEQSGRRRTPVLAELRPHRDTGHLVRGARRDSDSRDLRSESGRTGVPKHLPIQSGEPHGSKSCDRNDCSAYVDGDADVVLVAMVSPSGPATARSADSSASAAGHQCRTPAHARCNHVGSPVWSTKTPGSMRASSRRRSERSSAGRVTPCASS